MGGKLTKAQKTEKKKIKKLFKEMDTDADGTVSTEELGTAMKKYGLRDSEIDLIIKTFDTDGDGTINCEEFIDIVTLR